MRALGRASEAEAVYQQGIAVAEARGDLQTAKGDAGLSPPSSYISLLKHTDADVPTTSTRVLSLGRYSNVLLDSEKVLCHAVTLW